LTITPLPNGTTAISGPIVDQAALHGVLRKVRDLGVPLLSVTRVRPDQADASEVKDGVEASGSGKRPGKEICL
jgi:hypothetical protein